MIAHFYKFLLYEQFGWSLKNPQLCVTPTDLARVPRADWLTSKFYMWDPPPASYEFLYMKKDTNMHDVASILPDGQTDGLSPRLIGRDPKYTKPLQTNLIKGWNLKTRKTC